MRATVTTPSGERFEGVTGDLLAYYLSEAESVPGYGIVEDEGDAAAVFPQVWVDGQRVDVPATPAEVELESVEVPDGGQGDVTSSPRPSPNPAPTS